ncbi:hypothetical protein INT43_001410 [Umbelopsis isabellina]|uniref:Sodium/potassium exporting P-type ATPase 1 n=1 Tax=Mortierella isabellina TaxID=91625 RepID=A0A8H7PE10_MORIS|nr:hypothetical protein INT43_001410 [Umbelopsis isabellina]
MSQQDMSKTFDQKRPWHVMPESDVVAALDTDSIMGLNMAAVEKRLLDCGHNVLGGDNSNGWFKVLVHQLADAMNWIFLALGAVSYVLQDYITGSILIALSFANLYLSFSQEYAAEKTLAALRNLSSPSAMVIREGKECTVDSKDLVPGDILALKEGDSVAADIRLIYVSNFEVDEALLTGESLPVKKTVGEAEEVDQPLGDRTGMGYSSTIITKGRARGIVVATGMNTEIGKIAKSIEQSDQGDRTRLQKTLNKMYIVLLATAVLCVIIVLAANKFVVDHDLGMYAITAALSVLPAGLTTVLTLSLVLGGQEMTRHRAIVRKLKCLETLGSITHIFSDKTGTLTQAKMAVVRFWLPSTGYYFVSAKGLAPTGDVYATTDYLEDRPVESKHASKIDKDNISEELRELLHCSALCNMSSIYQDIEMDKEDPDSWIASGAPTEVALQVLAHKFHLGNPTLLANGWKLIYEYQFDSTIKRMSTLYQKPNSNHFTLYTKGAAERVITLCGMDQDKQNQILEHVNALATKGLRVMALAYKNVDKLDEAELDDSRDIMESNLTFIGLTGIYDPPREESRKAVHEAHEAGISVHMLTGDHEATAVAIAKELRILNVAEMSAQQIDSLVTTGPKFDALADDEVDKLPALPLVVARCSPETKVKMIQASHRRRDIAAMTGDGVNDSPSLRIADVGISMGKNGSDVAKQASDIILTDDNFATIIRAISEGRRIYQNMQRFLLYYWIALAACAIVILVNLFVRDTSGNPVAPFSTIQMIWFYVIISPPAAALSVQKASPTVMKEPPRPPTESVFNREIILDTLVYAVVWAGILLGAFYIVLFGAGNGVNAVNCDANYTDGCYSFYRARSVMIICFTYTSLVTAIHCRSYRRPEWSLRGLKETWKSTTMMGTLVFDTVGLLVFVYVPKVNVQGFRQLDISWEWGICFAVILLWIAFGEFFKLLKRQFLKPLSTSTTPPLTV